MKEIKVLGSGCAKCVKVAELIEEVANEDGIQVNIVKESSPQVMLEYGVMKTPAVVIDNHLVHSGSVPDKKTISQWL